MFLAALFIISKKWKQFNIHQLLSEETNGLYPNNRIGYERKKYQDMLQHCISLENIMLSKRN